jgi:LDH2 family malate/lactate/ureidoglycolate dehydrogenase
MATSGGMLFLAFCNSGGGARNVAPFGGDERLLSTNPIAFGVPAYEGIAHDIIADFATSQVSGSVIREQFLTGKSLHPEWVTGMKDEPLNHTRDFIRGQGALLPLGGLVTGHKGYALAIIAEILGGIAGGLMAGEHDPEWFSNAALFLFVDPQKLIPREELSRRIADLAVYLQAGGARLPGAGSRQRENEIAKHGLELPDHVCSSLKRLAGGLRLEIPAALPEIVNAADGPGATTSW